MTQRLASVTLLVRDYEEAIAYYTQSLGFTLVENTALTGGKRWVRIAPPGSSDVTLLLARASTRAQVARVGDQTGGRVFLFLQTSDFWQDHRAMRARGVRFCGRAPCGIVRNGGCFRRSVRQSVGLGPAHIAWGKPLNQGLNLTGAHSPEDHAPGDRPQFIRGCSDGARLL